jgi:alpha-galactosidase
MTPDIAEILTNKEVIAVDQDPLGRQGRRIRSNGDLEVWTKALSGNRMAVALLNKRQDAAAIQFSLEEIGMKGKMKMRDLWEHKNIGKCKGTFVSPAIPAHGVMVLLLKPVKK